MQLRAAAMGGICNKCKCFALNEMGVEKLEHLDGTDALGKQACFIANGFAYFMRVRTLDGFFILSAGNNLLKGYCLYRSKIMQN